MSYENLPIIGALTPAKRSETSIGGNDAPKAPGVYVLYTPDTFYLGSTKELQQRFQKHLQHLARGTHPTEKLQSSYDQHNGQVQLAYKVTENRDAAYDLELEMLQAAKGHPALANKVTESSRGPVGMVHTEETRRKMGQHMIGSKLNVGRKHSAETRAKKSLIMLGNQHLKGFKFSDEQRKHVSEGVRNSPHRRNKRLVVIEGVEYDSIQDAAEQLGINYSTLRDRLRMGRTKDESK